MARKKPIISPLGQWAYPGEVTIIPSNSITMKGVNYPVLGIDDLGNSQMMMPGQDYTFPGNYVTEIPQMGKGGLAQWFDEKWVDVKTGKACGRSGKDKNSRPYPACRPSKRVNETTPKTTSEMSSAEKAKFKREKTSGQRISYNHSRKELGGEAGWLEQYQNGSEVLPKSIGAYTNQFNEEISGLKDWYEANRKRIGEVVPEAYLTYDQKSYPKPYGPEADPMNYNFSADQDIYNNKLIPGVKSLYDLITDTQTERYFPPVFPFNFPKQGFTFNDNESPSTSEQGIANRFVYNVPPDYDKWATVKNYDANPPYVADWKGKQNINISNELLDVDRFKAKNDPSTIVSHETSHYLNMNNPEVFSFNRTKLGEMGITNTQGFKDYYGDGAMSNPSNTIDGASRIYDGLSDERKEDELLSDAYALKQDMRKKGFYDYTKGEKLTPEIWNKYKKEYGDGYIINRFTPVFKDQGQNNIEKIYNSNFPPLILNDNYNITDPFSPHLKNTKETPTFKTSDERIIHLLNEIVKNKDQGLNVAKYGGWLEEYQDGGTEQNPERMQGIDIRKKRSFLDNLRGYANKKLKAIGLDPYNERSDDFMEQWARRINTATGGKDWYKQPNDGSGTGGIGTAIMETVMAPFSAPQLASVYGATGKVQMPSEAMNIQNPVGAFLTDVALDPLSYVGAGLTRTGQKLIKSLPKQAGKIASSQINKNPRLALSLQRGRPVSLDNVNTISGITYGDVSPIANFNKIKPNNISESTFFKQLEKGVGSLDNSLQKRVADLESEEGFRRLVDQEKDYLFHNSDLEEGALERVAKINARARIDELKNVKNINKEATEYANTNFLGTDLTNTFVENSSLYNNAYYRPPSLYDQFVKSSGTLNLKKPTPNYSKSIPGEIGMGYNYVGNVPTEMHEIGHALQRGRELSLDKGLKNIVPKKELSPINQRNYKYFKKGSSGQEPTAFANELREAMLQKGFISDYYSPINQQQIQDAYKYFKKNPIGIYDKNTGNFSSNTRIFDFMAPNKSNSKLLTDVLNRLPAVAPLAIGAAAASQLPEQKNGGWLDTYQDGGENLPELNSKIDIANFYKNPLSEKYGIYQDPTDKGYKYYLKSGDEGNILESGPDLSNISSRRLAEINFQKGSLSDLQLANIKNVSPVILPEQKQRILRDKVYYDQEDLMEQAMSESPISSVKTPSYSEILESDPEFKKVMTEKPKPVAPIKPKPVATNTPLVSIGNAPRAIVKPAVRKVVAKNDIVNLADFTFTAADRSYLNKVEEYCPKGNCLETTRNAYDMTAGRIQGIPTSSDIWSNDLKVHSKKGTPTANDVKQYPYFAGDYGAGTVDSWDIHGVIVANGGKNLFNINNPTPIDYKKIPVGAVIGWGPANKKDSSYSGRSKGYNKQFGMQPSHHSTMVTGYSETGEPIVYDGFLKKYMTLTEAKANIGSSLSYELENISAPNSVLNNTQDNLRDQGILLNYIPPTNVNPNKILAAANQPWAQIEGRAPRFNKQMMTEFNSALMNNKGELMRNLNMSSEKYDDLAKIALAISAQESEGGGGLSFIDRTTVGMTQLNTDNIYKDDKLKKAASKPYMLNDGDNNILSPSLIQKSPSASAVASMIYLSQLEKSAQAKYNEGKVPKDRSFTKNSNIIKDALRSNTSKYNADGFFVEEANKRIDLSPFEGGMLSSPNPVAAQKLLNKTAGVADKYKVSVKNGSLIITMKTKGNADLTYPEIIGYGWQSLNTLKDGDAQGDSVHNKRIKNYYDLLNNTTPTYRKEGGETDWLNKYK